MLIKDHVDGMVNPIYDDFDNNKEVFHKDSGTTLVIQKI